jgi:hypothetical protein
MALGVLGLRGAAGMIAGSVGRVREGVVLPNAEGELLVARGGIAEMAGLFGVCATGALANTGRSAGAG